MLEKVKSGAPARWIAMLMQNQACTLPWMLYDDTPKVFELNPQSIDCAFSAESRWILAVLLSGFRKSSVLVRSCSSGMHAYKEPRHNDWLRSIEPKSSRSVVLEWHTHEAERIVHMGGVDLLDEMDAPLYSIAIRDFASQLIRENRLFSGGTWIATREECPQEIALEGFNSPWNGWVFTDIHLPPMSLCD